MTRYVDLHLHSRCSDGSDPPARVAQRAAEKGFAAMALADHDTVAGVPEARAAAEGLGLGFIDAVEISAAFEGTELHVVGLGIDIGNAPLKTALAQLEADRLARADRIIGRLAELGVTVDRGAIEDRSGSGTIGRMHIAQELCEQGKAKTVQKAFEKYLRKGSKAFIPKLSLPCDEAIDAIHAAGGLAFLAHPGIGIFIRAKMQELLALPFDGIEVYHTRHNPGQTEAFLQLAEERNLLVSGGSDCHGAAKNAPPEMGKVRVPYRHYERIVEHLAESAGTR